MSWARSGAAGAVAAIAWGLVEPLDRRVFRCDYSDIALLGKAITRGPRWRAAGFALHAGNGAAFGLAFEGIRRSTGLDGRRLAVGLALAEHVGLYPLGYFVDRFHPARGELGIPPLLTNPRAFGQATVRHLLFGVVLGRLARPGLDSASKETRQAVTSHDERTHMSKVEESIELDVPVHTAYNQWTQFEEFPQFMEHVDEVKQLDDEHLHWKVTIAGKTEEFDAEVTEQIPDTRIAWKSTSGRENAGAVDFHPLGDDRSQIMVALDAATDGAMEKVADASGMAARQLRGDLKRFKEMIEQRGSETGAWRGSVERDAS